MPAPEQTPNPQPAPAAGNPAVPVAALSANKAAQAADIFNSALDRPAAEREAFVRQACASDEILLGRVQKLLAANDAAENFLEPGLEMRTVIERASEAASEKAGEMIGPYKLREQIGEGGFGSVWVAEQDRPVKRRVALKIVKLGMDTKEVIARFEQERQTLAMMDHPNIAKVFDAGSTDNGRPYFVMELVRGVKITEYCDEKGLSTQERLELFITVCQAVQHAHQKGIIHRDLKPSNILVTIHDGRPLAKVIDFGVAKATQGRLSEHTIYTQFQQMIGTPLYMSPEQADMTSQDVDTRSDIYSLGVLLYELLTGGTPIDAATMRQAGLDEMRRMIREVDPPRPSLRLKTLDGNTLSTAAKRRHTEPAKLPGTLKGDLDWIVMKCLEKDRTRRYDTANGLALDLQRHLSNEVITARPPTAAYLLGKLIRRNKAAFAAAGAVALALVIGIVASVWQAVRATKAEKAAQAETKRAVSAESKALTEAERATKAEALAKDRLVESEKARADAEAISKFLTGMFESSRPGEEKGGREVKVADVLDVAAKKLETELADQPERRAQLQYTLAKTYHALGLYPQAIPLIEKVRNYHLTKAGPEHPETIQAVQSLATCYHAVGRREEALKLLEEVLALSRKVNGPEHPDTLAAMGNMAASYSDAGRNDEALKLQEEVLRLSRKKLDPEHPDTLSAMNNLAKFYDAVGRKNEALKLMEELVPIRRKVSGPEHPDTLIALNNLAFFYSDVGRIDEALKIQEGVVVVRRKVSGPVHSDTLSAMNNLAKFYLDTGRIDEALNLTEELLSIRRKLSGPEHPDTLMAMGNMAATYAKAHHYPEELKLLEELLSIRRKLSGPEHPDTLGVMHNLAASYSDTGRQVEALKLREEVLALRRKVLGPQHPDTLWAMHNLALSYGHAGRRDEALKLQEEVLALRRKVLGLEHPDTLKALNRLAESYSDAGRRDDAAKLRAEVEALKAKK